MTASIGWHSVGPTAVIGPMLRCAGEHAGVHTVDFQFAQDETHQFYRKGCHLFFLFFFFLLLMHLRVMHYELYCPCKESERLPGCIPNPFAKMINLAQQTERFPYPFWIYRTRLLGKQATECLFSE